MMKKIYAIIITILSLTACSSDTELPAPPHIGQEEPQGIRVEIEAPYGLGDADVASRSSLYYDDAKNIMEFEWDNSDCIGVFSLTDDPARSQQLKFTQIEDPSNTSMLRTFMTNDKKLQVSTQYRYLAYLPYFPDHELDYTIIPVDYTGQRQTKPVNFTKYRTDKSNADYKKSQKEASAHLGDYDFLCTGPTDPTPNGGILFKMNRMGAIVRFWIVIDPKNNYVYDELQLVNNSKKFTTKATMDANALTLTATEQSNVMSLQLGVDGFDLSDPTNNGSYSTNPFYDWKKETNTYTGYIMAYMMLAPINLQGDDVEKSVLYITAHEKDHPERKHYFKSPGLSKPNLRPNSFYKWTVYPEDMPIELTSITVEEWRESTTAFENDGNGTGKW